MVMVFRTSGEAARTDMLGQVYSALARLNPFSWRTNFYAGDH